MTAESNPILAWGLIALTTGFAALIVGVIAGWAREVLRERRKRDDYDPWSDPDLGDNN